MIKFTCKPNFLQGNILKPNVWTELVIHPFFLTSFSSLSKCLCCECIVLSQQAVAKTRDFVPSCMMGIVSSCAFNSDWFNG